MADIKIAVGTSNAPTSTGAFDLTISGLGWTPKAIMLIGSADPSSGGGCLSIAFADDGGRAFGQAAGESDSVTTMVGYSYATTNFRQMSAGIATQWEATIDSDDATAGPISNGWRLNVTDADTETGTPPITFVLFGGSDLTPYVFGGDAGDTIACGFAPDAWICSGGNAESYNSITSHPTYAIGFCDGTNYASVFMGSRRNVATSLQSARISTAVAAGFTYYGDSFNGGWSFTNIDSSGFDISGSYGAPGVKLMCGIALDLGGAAALVDTLDSMPSSGAWTYTGASFTPQFAMFGLCMIDTDDTTETDQYGGSIGVGVIAERGGSLEGAAHAVHSEDAVSTSNAGSASSTSSFVLLELHGGGTALECSIPGSTIFTSSGFSVPEANIPTYTSPERRVAMLLIEEASSGANEGAGSSTLGSSASTGAGTSAIAGAGTSTLADIASDGTGIGTANDGAGASTLAAVTSSGTGTLVTAQNDGAGASTLGSAASSGAGASSIEAAGASTLANQASAGAGTNATPGQIPGAGASALDAASGVGTGTVIEVLVGATYPLDFAEHAAALLAVNPPGSAVIRHRRAGVTLGYFRGFASQSALENGSLIGGTVHASPASSGVLSVAEGDTLAWEGPLTADPYTVEQVTTDGVALRRFVLRPHAR